MRQCNQGHPAPGLDDDRLVPWRNGARSHWRDRRTMILNAVIHGSYCYAETWPEKAALITEVMENLRSERRDVPWVSPGEIASFMFADRRHSESVRDWWPDNTI